MPQAVAHGAKFSDCLVQVVRFGQEHVPVNMQLPARGKHECDLVEREASGTPEGNRRQSFQHIWCEQAAQAAPANRSDQPFFLIEAKC